MLTSALTHLWPNLSSYHFEHKDYTLNEVFILPSNKLLQFGGFYKFLIPNQ